MHIAIFEVESWEKEAFRPLEKHHQVSYTAEPLTSENVADFTEAEVISTFIYTSPDRALLTNLPDLKLIATRSTGVDHIDLEYCRDQKILVANVPTYGENTVAEHVFALLLAISHNLIQAVDRTRKGDFSPRGLQGFDLEGKTLGVIGTGNIGRHTIKIARGFGMEVLAFDLQPDQEFGDRLGIRYVAMKELLAAADVITLHVPGGKATRNLIGSEQFAEMKNGVVLINTSRGTVVDARALLRAIGDGKVAAAGLDVLPEEPAIREEAELLRSIYSREHDLEDLLADHILLHLRNVVITPHTAFNTREAVVRIIETTRENIEAFAEGKPVNLVE